MPSLQTKIMDFRYTLEMLQVSATAEKKLYLDTQDEKHLKKYQEISLQVTKQKIKKTDFECLEGLIKNDIQAWKRNKVSLQTPCTFSAKAEEKNHLLKKAKIVKTIGKIAKVVQGVFFLLTLAFAAIVFGLHLASHPLPQHAYLIGLSLTIGGWSPISFPSMTSFVLDKLNIIKEKRLFCSENFKYFAHHYLGKNGFHPSKELLLDNKIHAIYKMWQRGTKKILSPAVS